MEEDKLIIDVENTGQKLFVNLQVEPELEGIEPKRIRIYPSQTNRVEFDISHLKDKLYKNVRVILDSLDTFIKVEKIEFRKGPLPEEIPLAKVKITRLARKRRSGKPHLYLSLDYGSRRRGLSLARDLRMGNFSLSAGSIFSEYFYQNYESEFSTYRVTASISISVVREPSGLMG